MAHDGTAAKTSPGTALMIPHARSSYRPSLARSAATTDFLSQMLAERERLPAQRLRRRAPVAAALDAYAEGKVRGTPQLPAGFFRSRLV